MLIQIYRIYPPLITKWSYVAREILSGKNEKKVLKVICIFCEMVYIKLLSQINAVLVELKRFNKIWKNKKNFAWQMQNMVYIKRHAESERTSAGWFEISFQKKWKIFQKAFDKTKKYAILNSCHAFLVIVSKNGCPKKSLKKNSNIAWQIKKVCYIKNSLPVTRQQVWNRKLRKWKLLMFLEKLNSANGPDLSGERSKTLKGIRFGRFF